MINQQLFAIRLCELIKEKNITQQILAQDLNRSKQGINFYCQGKRFPDIVIAGEIAEYFGVSCDYLVGLSDYRNTELSKTSLEDVGISEKAVDIFGELKALADGVYQEDRALYEEKGLDYEKTVLPYIQNYGKTVLSLLNKALSDDKFKIMMQYVKKYYDLKNGVDMHLPNDEIIVEIPSATAQLVYGSKEEEEQLKEDFLLFTIGQYMKNIAIDIIEDKK